jgi:hypothetical protein
MNLDSKGAGAEKLFEDGGNMQDALFNMQYRILFIQHPLSE